MKTRYSCTINEDRHGNAVSVTLSDYDVPEGSLPATMTVSLAVAVDILRRAGQDELAAVEATAELPSDEPPF